MTIEPNKTALLVAFARAASKAQEIEAILKDTLSGAEVAEDTRNRLFKTIAKEIDKLPLGPLQKKYFEMVGKDIHDPGFKKSPRHLSKNSAGKVSRIPRVRDRPSKKSETLRVTNKIDSYEVRLRKDRRGFDLISD